MRHPWCCTIAFLCLASTSDGSAQDVELLGQRYGTRPPQSYYDEIARDPGAFRFKRGRAQRGRAWFADAREGAGAPGLQLLRALPRAPVIGTFTVPVVPALYSNSGASPPVTRDTIAGGYFGAGPGTITDYYDEVSGGRVTLEGDVREWVQLTLPDTVVTDGRSGLFRAPLGGGGAGNFVYEAVALQVGMDWGPYDNDGPDGIANSGDDDGFVDFVAIVQPDAGGECNDAGERANRIWSHRWSLSEAVFETFVTGTPSMAAGGGFIQVDDYVVVPSISCYGGWLTEIGVFTHELGHAFGLPDLYDTDGGHAGAGTWDLMASGSWGCNWQVVAPAYPCHLGAWSKEALGWVDVVTLAPDTDHGMLTLPPVETEGIVYRVDANDGSGEYFLLENRQRLGYDRDLYHEGLLVWQIDPDWVQELVPCGSEMLSRLECNQVNAFEHMGVWLRQGDGLDQLGRAGPGRGDRGDPFPGWSGNDAFHAVSNPAATSYLGGPTGVTLTGIVEVGDDVQLELVTGFTTVTVRADGAAVSDGLFTLDGAPLDPPQTSWVSAPFVEHTIEAVAGEAVAPGERRPFVEWRDAPAEPRIRVVPTPLMDTELVAGYGGAEFELGITLNGGVAGIEPATISSDPVSADLWYPADTEVTLELVPVNGFDFLGWSGALAGQPNPASFPMSGPRSVEADFRLIYAVSTGQIDLTATRWLDVQLLTENGTAPYTWRVVSGTMPYGLSLSATGRVTGTSIDQGTFEVVLEAIDAIGLEVNGTVTFEAASPVIPIEQLASPFLLSGPALEPVQLNFLNRQGNGVAGYDLGDFRAWVLANPTLPMSAYLGPSTVRGTVVLPMRFEENEDGR